MRWDLGAEAVGQEGVGRVERFQGVAETSDNELNVIGVLYIVVSSQVLWVSNGKVNGHRESEVGPGPQVVQERADPELLATSHTDLSNGFTAVFIGLIEKLKPFLSPYHLINLTGIGSIAFTASVDITAWPMTPSRSSSLTQQISI